MDQRQQVVRIVDGALGANALGIYLYGSAIQGGLRPASDLDVLVVTADSMDEQQRRDLTDGLLTISGRFVGARPIELTVVVRSEVRPWRYPPTGDYQYGEWLRAEIESDGPPRPEPMPDLAVTITTTLAGNHPLSGPPPEALLDPVPHADLIRSCVAGVPELLDDLDDDTRNVVLTLARIWTTLATGEIRTKDAAADWALARLPVGHRPVLEHAKLLYLTRTYREETWTDDLIAQVRPHAEAVLAEITALI